MPSRRREPVWLPRIVVDAMHADQIREHGGLPGLRDEGALESALARPRHQWHYGRTHELADLAAAYGFALSANHPYLDGNTRVALLAMLTFLDLNGCGFEADDEDVLVTILTLADGRMTEAELATWIRRRVIRSG